MTLAIIEYANGYTHDDIWDGDIRYQRMEEFRHEFDDVEEAIDFLTGYSEHAIRRGAEGSCAPIGVLEAADWERYWISVHETEFRHGVYPPAEEGGSWLGGDWFTDRSWHFTEMTVIERTRIFLAIQPNVYGMKPYWR